MAIIDFGVILFTLFGVNLLLQGHHGTFTAMYADDWIETAPLAATTQSLDRRRSACPGPTVMMNDA